MKNKCVWNNEGLWYLFFYRNRWAMPPLMAPLSCLQGSLMGRKWLNLVLFTSNEKGTVYSWHVLLDCFAGRLCALCPWNPHQLWDITSGEEPVALIHFPHHNLTLCWHAGGSWKCKIVEWTFTLGGFVLHACGVLAKYTDDIVFHGLFLWVTASYPPCFEFIFPFSLILFLFLTCIYNRIWLATIQNKVCQMVSRDPIGKNMKYVIKSCGEPWSHQFLCIGMTMASSVHEVQLALLKNCLLIQQWPVLLS